MTSLHHLMPIEAADILRRAALADGIHVALAELLDAPLAALDQRLAAAPGPRCRSITPS